MREARRRSDCGLEGATRPWLGEGSGVCQHRGADPLEHDEVAHEIRAIAEQLEGERHAS